MTKKYVAHYITEQRVEKYIRTGKCPVCMLRLDSVYHTNCEYLDDLNKIVDKKMSDGL